MSYRSIKRVLGESSLERKIRILFGICLLILIAGSFLWVNRITEELIRKNTSDKAHELTTDFLLREHLRNIITKTNDQSEEAALIKSLAKLVESTPYDADAMVIDDRIGRRQLSPTVVTDPTERELLSQMLDAARHEQEAHTRSFVYGVDQTSEPEEERNSGGRNFKHQFTTGDKYVYYTPVVFKSVCLGCHLPKLPDEASTEFQNLMATAKDNAEQQRILFENHQQVPPVFMRITLDYNEAKSAINRSRAILMAVAIVTAFLSMIALYLIVRYVIVKPLRHLRDVSDEISHGRMDVRAELHTGDDFEQLSRSFNRMLRHLLDTQVALQGANEDLDRKVDEQAQLNLKLYEMNQVKSEFLANMSHELRTPLNSIIGFSEILEGSGGLPAKQRRYAANIRQSGTLLLDLINDILDLAKLEAGKLEVNPSEFRIHQLMAELCEMLRNLAETKNIQMVLSVDSELPELYQDEVKIRQILTNLLANAIKFTPEGGRINLSADKNASDQLVMKIQDTGVGIAENDREIIFEKFRQGPSAIGRDSLTREFSGTGLGLSIVKELCILLGGSIQLDSEVGRGSIFTVTMPWNLNLLPRISSDISQSIDEITKSSRVDFARAHQTPRPPAESSESNAQPNSPDHNSRDATPLTTEGTPPIPSEPIEPR